MKKHSHLSPEQDPKDQNPYSSNNKKQKVEGEENKNYEKVDSILKQIESDPSNPILYSNLGIAYFQLDMNYDGIKQFSKAIKLELGTFSGSNINLDRIKAHIASDDTEENIITMMTMKDWRTPGKLDIESKSPLSLYFHQLASDWDDDTDQETVNLLWDVTKLNLVNPEPLFYYYVGHALSYRDQHNDAIFAFEKSINIKPFTQSFYYADLAHCYYQVEKYQEAIGAYKEAFKIDPSFTDQDENYFDEFLHAHRILNKYPAAIKFIHDLLVKSPEQVDLWLNLGYMLMDYGDTNVRQCELIKQGLISYSKAEDEGYKKIIKFCNEDMLLSTASPHLYYPFLHNLTFIRNLSNYEKKAALPALRLLTDKNFKSGNYFKAFEAFETLEQIKYYEDIKLTEKLDLYVIAKESLKILLEIQYPGTNTPFKQSSLAKYVALSNGAVMVPNENGNITEFLNYKMAQYVSKINILTPKYVEKIKDSLFSTFGDDTINEILSFLLVNERAIESVETPKRIVDLLSNSPLFTDIQAALAGEVENEA